MSQAEQDKPKYGQYQQPEYGAMSGQYGPNYNPYIYGAPEPDTKKDSAAAAGDNGGAAQSQQAGQPYGQQPAWPGNQQAGGWPYAQGGQQSGPGAYPGGYPGMQGQPYGQQPNGQPHQPHYYHGIDLNDPNQNPLRALGFVCDHLLYPRPVLPGASALGTDGRGGNVAHAHFPYEGLRFGRGRRGNQRAVHHRRHLDGLQWL